MKNDILVSVCMITYNHEKYISQAVEGVLMQKTNFLIELIIGEDCSTDNTRNICLEYKEKYPDIIKLLLSEKNLGMMQNFITTLQSCTGKYIALCEGDDYWTDPHKLQKQVDFLEENLEFSSIACKAKLIGNLSGDFGLEKSRILIINDFTKHRPFHTASFLFRKKYIEGLQFPQILSSDRFLYFFLASKGNIYYSEEIMVIYRKHSEGLSSVVTFNMMKKDLNIIEFFKDDNSIPSETYKKLKIHILKTMIQYSTKINFRQFITTYMQLVKLNGISYSDSFKLTKNFLYKAIISRLK